MLDNNISIELVFYIKTVFYIKHLKRLFWDSTDCPSVSMVQSLASKILKKQGCCLGSYYLLIYKLGSWKN